MKPLINVDELDFFEWGHGERFACRLGLASHQIGGQQLGCNVTEVPVGKCAFPRHNHRHNEELFYVLEGTGTLRMGEDQYPVRPGDLIACPAGGRDLAHQLINDGDCTLRYLAISTTRSPEVVEYPDSDKIGVTVELDGEKDPTTGLPPFWRIMTRQADAEVDYWEGED